MEVPQPGPGRSLSEIARSGTRIAACTRTVGWPQWAQSSFCCTRRTRGDKLRVLPADAFPTVLHRPQNREAAEFPHRGLLTQPTSDLFRGSCGSRLRIPSSHDEPPRLTVGRRDKCNLLSYHQSLAAATSGINRSSTAQKSTVKKCWRGRAATGSVRDVHCQCEDV